jgi:Lipid-droplet associated hydrolase
LNSVKNISIDNFDFNQGNPGLTAYYEEFVDLMHKGVNKPVWAVCHAGHEFEDNIPSPDGKMNYKNIAIFLNFIFCV